MTFDEFTVVLLLSGDNPPAMTTDQRNELQDAHLAHLSALQKAGYLVAAGPITGEDNRDLRGISLLTVGVDRARTLCSDDPGVTSGVFKLEIFSWLVPGGAMSFHQAFFPSSIAEAIS